jgi:raffinose/stachyose/melibiose transport system substrate-binding protein
MDAKNPWRRLAVVVTVVAAVGLVAGVSATSAKTKASVTLKLAAMSNGQGNVQVDQLITAFEKKNPDIKIDATYLPIGEPYANTVRTELQSGNGPDVFYVSPGSGGIEAVLPLAKAGYVADLSKRPWAKKLPLATSSRPLFGAKGKLYAVPIDVVPIGVMYQPSVSGDVGVGVPKTMSQLLAACRTAKTKGHYYLNIAGANTQNSSLLADTVAGSYVFAKNPNWSAQRAAGKVTFAGTPAWAKALQRIVDMKNAGCFPPGAESNDNIPATPTFVSGQTISWVLPSSVMGIIKSINPTAHYNFFPLPGDTASDTRVYASPTDAFSVNAKSGNKAAALKFMDFLATPAASGMYSKSTGATSVWQASGGHTWYELRGLTPLLKQKNKVLPLQEILWANPTVTNTLGKDVQGLLTGQKTVQQTLADLDAAWGK